MQTDGERWGRIIKAARESELFMTQAELAQRITSLAEEAGVDITCDQSTISRWEKGQEPSLRVRPFVAKAVDIPAAALFQRAEAEVA